MPVNNIILILFSLALVHLPLFGSAQVERIEDERFCETQLLPREVTIKLRWLGRIEQIVQRIMKKQPGYRVLTLQEYQSYKISQRTQQPLSPVSSAVRRLVRRPIYVGNQPIDYDIEDGSFIVDFFSWNEYHREITFDERNLENNWRPVGRKIHDLLGDHQFMADFVRRYLTEVLDRTLEKDDRTQDPLYLSKDAAREVIHEWAADSGWYEIIAFSSSSRVDFYTMLSKGHLFRDTGIADQRHTTDGHILQILAVAPEIDRIFGPYTMRQFLIYLGMTSRKDAWNNLFDLRPPHHFNFHSPAAFFDFEVVQLFHNWHRMTDSNYRRWEPLEEAAARRRRELEARRSHRARDNQN